MSEGNGSAKRVLGKRELFALPRPAPEPVELEQGVVYVRAISSAEREAWENASYTRQGDKVVPACDVRARLVALCACDENGVRVFTDDDAGQIGLQPAAPVQRIFEAAQRLNRIGQAEEERAVKNSATTPASASSSSSPDTSESP
jgi:hypothetical protein